MAINFADPKNIVNAIDKLVKIQESGIPPIPTTLILLGAPKKQGMSAARLASAIIKRKTQAKIGMGATLPSGVPNPDEIMERIRAEEYIKHLQQNAKITVAIPPGITLSAAGANAGGPITVLGSTIKTTRGFAQIS